MTREERECREKVIQDNMASIENRVRHAFNQGYNLGQMKSGKQEPKQGHWTNDNHGHIVCSNCNETNVTIWKSKYCPNCGARMESEKWINFAKDLIPIIDEVESEG